MYFISLALSSHIHGSLLLALFCFPVVGSDEGDDVKSVLQVQTQCASCSYIEEYVY